MQKKISLTIGLFAFVLLAVLVFLRSAEDHGAWRVDAARLMTSWSSQRNVSNSGQYDASQHPRAVQAPDTYLHVAWMEGVLNTATGPAYVRGQDSTWPAWQWAGPSNNIGYVQPTLAVDSAGTVHMVWSGGGNSPYEIYYAYKPSGGAWSSWQNISNDPNNSIYASIAVDSQNRLWVVYERQIAEGNHEIYMVTKPAGGTWSTPLNISNRGSEDLEPSIAVDSNDVPHVVWRNGDASPNWEILYTRYVGGSWQTPYSVSANSTPSHFGRVAADDNGNVFVVWEDEISTNRFEILHRYWNGTEWSATTQVSNATKALYPAVAVDNSCNVYVVWTDYRQSPTEAYFSYSNNCGSTWSSDENASRTSSYASFFPDVVAEAGGAAHVFWQDTIPGQLDIYYAEGTVSVGPSPTPTNTPTPIPPTATPTPTPDPAPYGWVDIIAIDPPEDRNFTRDLTVDLHFWADSDVGNQVTEMRYCNMGDCDPLPAWETFLEYHYDWELLDTGWGCEWKPVLAWFRDDQGTVSDEYADYIVYDNYLSADMVINGNNEYTSRELVMINSTDTEPDPCSGLSEMRIWDTLAPTYTHWISYFPDLYFPLSPGGPITHTVFVEYRDRAGNVGALSDTILLDTNPPYSGTPPTLNDGNPATHLIIPMTGLEAYDDESGVASVWAANYADGPWMVMAYHDPPYTYDWNLAYGGPPIEEPDLHTVYVMYEDASGYGAFPGNLSEAYESTILVSGITNIYLPLVTDAYEPGALTAPGDGAGSDLTLLVWPRQTGGGEELLLAMSTRQDRSAPREGTFQLTLPEGLRVVQAWSAYGQLLQADDRLVVSREQSWNQQSPWILVYARVEEGAADLLQVRGDLLWDDGTVSTRLLQVRPR